MLKGLFIATTTFMMLALVMVFVYVPTEATMGVIQRIFYVHVPVAWVGMLSFAIVFASSIGYLWKRNLRWDQLGSAAAEIGVIFATLMLATGSIWARPIWGVWWVWEPRLATALVMWFIYLAYLILRAYVSESHRRATFSAIIGIIGFIDVPIVALAINLWPTQHPNPVIFSGGMAPSMMATLMASLVAFTCLFILLLLVRSQMKHYEESLAEIKARLALEEQ